MAVRRLAPVQAYSLPPAVCWRPARLGVRGGGPSLYWAPQSRCPVGEGVVAYSTDDKVEFAYEAFNAGRDFGPLDIARTVMYCRWVDALCAAHAGCAKLVHITSDVSGEDRANTVVLCCAYLVLAQGFCAVDAFRPFAGESLVPFLDCRGESAAGSAISDEDDVEFELSVLDILRGLERARDLGWLDYHVFSVEDHSQMLRPEHGDMSWLLPGLALAFASPWSEPQDQDGLPVCTPASLAPYFRRNNIGLVVQCNAPEREEEGERRRLLCYEPRSFEELGVRHVLLAFEDGGCPSVDILLRFLEIVKSSGCGFAVHCRSGLGRTATVIGAYAIQNLGFTARSFIGWARVMRPGTVHGSQQQYLVNMEPHLRPGSARPLESLDQRERLRLLPRRELRFWALDCGIPAVHTRLASEASIIEMILQAHGVHVPLQLASVQPLAPVLTGPAPSSALRAPDPAQQARLAQSAAVRAQATAPLAAPPVRLAERPVGGVVSHAPPPAERRPLAPRPTSTAPSATGGAPSRGSSAPGSYSAASPLAPAPAAPAPAPAAAAPPLGTRQTAPAPAPATVAAATAAAATAAAAASVAAAAAAAAASAPAPAAQALPSAAPAPAPAKPQAAPRGTAAGSAGEAAAAGTAPSGLDASASSLSGLHAAIQSLNRGLMSSGSMQESASWRASGQTSGTRSPLGSVTSLGSTAPSSDFPAQPAAQRLDEWEEILRYLRLLMAVQAAGAPSWEHVQHFVERLRDQHANGAGPAAAQGRKLEEGGAEGETAEARELRQLRGERQAALRQAEEREGELTEALQQARGLQRECEQLKFRISLERKARSTERVRMAEHGENLSGDLRSTEERLRRTESDIEEMQRHMLEHDDLELWQKERVESLRQEISEARELALEHAARGRELGARRDAAQEASRRRLREAAGQAARLPEAALLSEASTWDDQRRSIERIRDQVHLAMQQARVTVTAP